MYYVSLKQFEGPLDLLLHLITKAKVDIKDIFVSEITEQYLESMKLVDELDMDSASEFLQMAATLLEIKSRAMLPKPPAPEDPDALTPEQELIRQLTEYKQFKEISARMHQLEEDARALLTKLPEEYPLPPPNIEITGLTLDKLARAFRRVLDRYKTNKGQKIIFIHGKGEGVLRQAIIHELNYKYKHFQYQDASFQEYGYGATQVTIR